MSYTITEKCNGCGACVRICPASAIAGEKKKLHEIDEKECIECGACGRICPQTAVLDGQGVTCVMVKRSEWPKPDIVLENCVACGICIDACPSGCLALSDRPRSKGVDAYPYLKEARACIACSFCSQACPTDAITMKKPVKAEKAAAAGEAA